MLSPKQIKQKEFILSQYPMLDATIVETILLTPEDKLNETVNQIKNDELKHEEPPKKYIFESVTVE